MFIDVEILSGLLIRQPWIDLILNGSKKWEIRGSPTQKRGPVALIKSGSGKVVGVADLVDVIGPLSLPELVANARNAGFRAEELPYERTFAWVLRNAHKLPTPVPYSHPGGAVIWVTLSRQVSSAVLHQLHEAN